MASNATLKKLKEFRRAKPNKEESFKLFQELVTDDNDRACAIIAASLLEDNLISLFQAHMRSLSNEWYEKIFEGNGPLASFSSLIKTGYVLEYYDNEARRNLDTIREIRNTFAHTKKPLTFNTPEISNSCKLLTYFSETPLPSNSPRNIYIGHTMQFSTFLLNIAIEKYKARNRGGLAAALMGASKRA